MIDPYCVGKLKGKAYIITTVLEELDKHKYDNGEVGRNIREFARILDKNELLNIEFVNANDFFELGIDGMTNDDIIIDIASTKSAILVTNDILMSIKARTQGVKTQKYEEVSVLPSTCFNGLIDCRNQDLEVEANSKLFPNQFKLTDSGIFRQKNNKLKRLSKDKNIWGITHKNIEQKCAIDVLLDDDVKLVTITGIAGTGKTLISIACALEKAVTENKYKKILVSRPIIPMGNEIGFLPGDINDKLGPWMQPIFDNLDFLFNTQNDGEKNKDAYAELSHSGILKIEALTYIRGRSIPNQFIIIDEAQNLTKHEVKTIISRAGENTKIVLTGDIDQIDNPKLDSINNGLTYVIEKFKDQEIAAHIELSKGERSTLANIAAKIL